jgi:serine/threonine protein kinase
MGQVYRARDARLNRDVAIKVSGEQFSERFESEAKAIAALNHPNICQIYDVGPDFLVMEYIDGRPIVDCEQPQALPPDEALQLARQIAAALETAHGKGVGYSEIIPAICGSFPEKTPFTCLLSCITAQPSKSPSTYPNDEVARALRISFPIDILYVARYCPIDSR